MPKVMSALRKAELARWEEDKKTALRASKKIEDAMMMLKSAGYNDLADLAGKLLSACNDNI